MSKLKVLYVASEINPFLQVTQVADFVRKMPAAMQERGMEIRILVPRFGIINERRNRLHEVVRLSGINITVGDEEKPLVIKVASIPNAKLQVYFIDNEDYFQRKTVFHDNNNQFYADNDERAIFFCKGAIETVKKLGWQPDIVHCTDWMTALIPMYLKVTYKKDPIFKDAKCVFSVYNNSFDYKFDASSIVEKAKMMDIEDSMLSHLASADFAGFTRMGMQYADVVIRGEEEYSPALEKLLADHSAEATEAKVETMPPSSTADSYYNLYTELVG